MLCAEITRALVIPLVTRAVAQDLLSKQSEHHKSYGFGTVIWG